MFKQLSFSVQHNVALHGICRETANTDHSLIFLHGYLDNCHSFKRLLPYFHNYKLYAFDLPGHGLSDFFCATQSTFSFFDFVEAIERLISRIDQGPVTLVGHSFGAAIGLIVAAQHPKIVKNLILLDTLVPMFAKPEGIFERLRRLPRLSTAAPFSYPTRDIAIETRSRQGIVKKLAQDLAERSLIEISNGFQWRYDPRLLQTVPESLSDHQVRKLVTAIDQPTLYLESTANKQHVNRPEKQRYMGLFPNFQFQSIEGGHHFHAETPERVASTITRFLQNSTR